MNGWTDGWTDIRKDGQTDGPKSGLWRCMNNKHSKTLEMSFNWLKHPLNNFVTERQTD